VRGLFNSTEEEKLASCRCFFNKAKEDDSGISIDASAYFNLPQKCEGNYGAIWV